MRAEVVNVGSARVRKNKAKTNPSFQMSAGYVGFSGTTGCIPYAMFRFLPKPIPTVEM